MSGKTNRRQFIGSGFGALFGISAKYAFSIFPEAEASFVNTTSKTPSIPKVIEEGRMEGSFLILPIAAKIPEFVIPAERVPPNVCAAGVRPEDLGNLTNMAISEQVDSVDELKRIVDFKYYTWDESIDSRLRIQNSSIIRYPTEEIFLLKSGLEKKVNAEYWTATARLSALTNYSKPFILREPSRSEISELFGEESQIGLFESVDFLPTIGVMAQTIDGYIFVWEEEGILLTLITEEEMSFDNSLQVIHALQPIPDH